MAFPTLASSVTGFDTDGGSGNDFTTRNATLPSGITAGDLLIAFISIDNAPGTGTGAISESGWNYLVNTALAGSRITGIIAYKVATGSEGSNITITCSAPEAATWIIVRISGADSGTPPEVSTPTTTASPPNPALLDPAGWGNEDTLWIAAAHIDTAFAPMTAAPTNYTNFLHVENNVNTNAGTGTAVAFRQLTASSEDPGPFTDTIDPDNTAYTVAVRGLAAGTTYNKSGLGVVGP